MTKMKIITIVRAGCLESAMTKRLLEMGQFSSNVSAIKTRGENQRVPV